MPENDVATDRSYLDAVEELRAEIKRLRKEVRKVSHNTLADRTGYTRQYISLIEKPGGGLPSGGVVKAIDRALDAKGELERLHQEAERKREALRGKTETEDRGSAIISRSRPALEPEDVRRRNLLRLISIAGAMLVSPAPADVLDVDRIDHFATVGRRMNAETLEDYVNLHRTLWSAFALSKSKVDVYPLVRSQLDELASSLERVTREDTRRRLHALLGDISQLAGEIFFDCNQYTEASSFYSLAASASREAGDFDLWACAMTRHAFVDLYDRRFAEAEGLLNAASHLARRGDRSLSTRYWVDAVTAHAHAGQGDFSSCMRALDSAEEVHNLRGEIHNGGWLRFDGSRLTEERGGCFVVLHRPDLAEGALVAVLDTGLTSRRRGSVLTDLATIGAQRRDVERVVSYSQAALDIARRTNSSVVARKLRTLRPQFKPFLGDARVSQMDKDVAALTSYLDD